MKDAISRFKRDVSGSEDAAMITSDDLGGTDHVTAADTFNTEDAAGAGTNMETRNITSANSDNVDNQDQEVDLSTSQSNNNSANSSPNVMIFQRKNRLVLFFYFTIWANFSLCVFSCSLENISICRDVVFKS